MDIQLDNHYNARVYNSGSPISGRVIINSRSRILFDGFEILLNGIAYTQLDYAHQFPMHSSHTFMALNMPLQQSDIPDPPIFEADRCYAIPFNFVLPYHLPTGSCNHPVDNPVARQRHLRLPPSLGQWEKGDNSPDMTRIEYTIQAQAWEMNRTGGKVVGLKAEVPLKVLPWAPEEAPLCITSQDQTYYRLCMTKKLLTASSLLKPSVLTVVAAQPQAVMLSVDGSVASKSTIKLSLIFKPCSENAALPQLHAVKAKLQSLTFVSAAPMRSFPDLGTLNHGINPIIPFSLFDRLKLDGIGPLHWVLEHDSGILVSREAAFDFENNRQGGRINTPSSPPSESFLATLGVPIDLSVLERRFLPPSFHSCLVCRAYVVRLDVYMGPMRTRISLRIPLQIAVQDVNDSPYDSCPRFEERISQTQGQDVDLGLQVQAGRDLQIPAEVNDLPEYAE